MTTDIRYRWFKNRMAQEHPRTWGNVHEDCRDAIFNYLVYGYEPGGFLTAVLCNDLYRAATVCDFENAKRLTEVARFVIQALPGACYGNREIMAEWMAKTNEEREQILIKGKLLPDTFELIKFVSAEGPLTDPVF